MPVVLVIEDKPVVDAMVTRRLPGVIPELTMGVAHCQLTAVNSTQNALLCYGGDTSAVVRLFDEFFCTLKKAGNSNCLKLLRNSPRILQGYRCMQQCGACPANLALAHNQIRKIDDLN